MLFKKPERKVTRVFIHCSASDNPDHDNILVIREWHLQRGFHDVGYHYFIRKDGIIQKGRELDQIPAAQKGHNDGTIAICCHGLDIDKFPESQLDSLLYLCEEINQAYERISFHGHCEVDSGKTCPVLDYKKLLELDERGYMPVIKKEGINFWNID